MDKKNSYDESNIPETNHTGMDLNICTEPDNDKKWLHGKYLPIVDRDLMIISSYGEAHPEDIHFAKKREPVSATTATRYELANEELDHMLDLYREDENTQLVYCYADHGLQMGKDYYMKRIKKFLRNCKKESAHIFYTGNSEQTTGNWCFKDGVITFQEIYKLYIECFSGKRLGIICDCSYSGSWGKECAELYDKKHIPSCGHHSRHEGLLLSVRTSCKYDQEATIMAYAKEEMELSVDKVVMRSKVLTSTGQKPMYFGFTVLHCGENAENGDKKCKFKLPENTWKKYFTKKGYI